MKQRDANDPLIEVMVWLMILGFIFMVYLACLQFCHRKTSLENASAALEKQNNTQDSSLKEVVQASSRPIADDPNQAR